jgi:hypothetical protein
MSIALQALALVWLLILTVGFLGLVRYLGTLQASNVGGKAPQGGWLFDTDGPMVPSPLPTATFEVLKRLNLPTEDVTVTFFSSRCGNCLEHAEAIAGLVADPSKNVFLITGLDDDALASMRARLAPTGAQLVFDPAAHDIVKSLDINSTPFVFRVVDGVVTAKSFIRKADDYVHVASVPVEGRSGSPMLHSGEPIPASRLTDGATNAH